ncbi:MAG: YdcF family protein [Bacillota bacterium]|nr:YdcF family protein [Bacillota bacterium]
MFLIFGILFILYYFICGFIAGFDLSILWVWPAAGCFFILIHVMNRKNILPKAVKILKVLIYIGVIVFITLETVIASGFLCKGTGNLDYIIVPGARVKGDKPGQALEYRIVGAYKYLSDYPDTKIIACGGKGSGETVSEAECIRSELVKSGIPENRIYIEDKSTNTGENIKYTFDKFPFLKNKDIKIGIVTNNFHIRRSTYLAMKRSSAKIYGIPVRYSIILLPHSMMREVCAIIVDTIQGNII